jgi:hypothetical protein
VLLLAFSVTLLTRLLRFIFLSLNSPHGDVDAWGIWNLRARFLFAGGDQWRETFSLLLTGSNIPDYPLLLPLTIARFWSYRGEDSLLVPAGVALLFTFAIVGLGLSSLTTLRARSQGLLTALVLVGTSFLIKHGASQYADVPLAYYILATLALFCLQDKSVADNYRLLTLAGAMAGFAAWTKNEGVLFLAAIMLVRLVLIVPKHGWACYGRQLLAFTVGLLPVLGILVYFRTQLAPGTTPVLSQDPFVILAKLQNVANYAEVATAMAAKILRLGHPGLVLLLLYAVLLGIRREPDKSSGSATAALTLGVVLLGYFFVFIITPFVNVRYQLDTSLDRLWLHLWPSAVFTFFLVVKTPEEALAPKAMASAER